MVEIIIVPTIPHTGTQSIMNLLDAEGYNKLKSLKGKDKNRNSMDKEDVFAVSTNTHNHILLWELLPTWQEFLDSGKDLEDHYLIDKSKINIIHGHIESELIHIIEPLVRLHDTIIPLRDPLLTLISTRTRNTLSEFMGEIEGEKHILKKHKEGRTEFKGTMSRGMSRQIEGWIYWARALHQHKPFYVPLDLETKDLKFKDYNFDKIGVHNSVGDTPLGRAYSRKDLMFIARFLRANLWVLMRKETKLRPALEEIGYSDLMWWHCPEDVKDTLKNYIADY